VIRGKLLLGLVLVCFVGASASAYAAKPGPAPTLTVSWPLAAAGTNTSSETPYVVAGCGYDAQKGGVEVVVQSPQALAFAGSPVDANGCISVTDFATTGPGQYSVRAYQTVHGRKVLVASTSFDV
jgi:hypothetical protein